MLNSFDQYCFYHNDQHGTQQKLTDKDRTIRLARQVYHFYNKAKFEKELDKKNLRHLG
jgi:hypothetical protein